MTMMERLGVFRRSLWGAFLLAFSICGYAVASPSLSVENVSFRQRYPWNGLVDIDCTVKCSDPTTNVSLHVTAKDTVANRSLAVRNVRLDSDASEGGVDGLAVTAGTHRIVWDAGADNPNFVSDAVTVEVQALPGTGLYLVVDLSGGTDAASCPVSYLGAEPQGGWTDEYKSSKLVLRRVPAGSFTTGSPADELGRHSGEIQHGVTISKPFYVGVFEVTQRQWELVTGTRPGYFANPSCYATRPVERVSYYDVRGSSAGAGWPSSSAVDATSFLGRLRAKTGLDGFDLPTEAQWEYVCRAGTTTALNSGKNLANTGSDANMDAVGRYWYNGGSGYSASCTTASGTAAVGSYAPNAWGLYDLHGNVWEWRLDWHGSLSSAAAADPVGSASGSSRVLRGGCWGRDADDCRSATRNSIYPSYRNYHGGFRLCCSAGLR